jgi:hypothetical protein
LRHNFNDPIGDRATIFYYSCRYRERRRFPYKNRATKLLGFSILAIAPG